MLALLMGLMIGLLLARELILPLSILLGFALIGCLFTLLLAGSERHKLLWMLCFLLSSISCAWSYGIVRLPATPSPGNLALPEREVQLTIEIEQVLHIGQRYGTQSGLAHVISAPRTSRLHTGDQIYFRLKVTSQGGIHNLTEADIQPGLQIQTTGVLSPILPVLADTEDRDFDAYLKSIGVHYRFDRTSALHCVQAPAKFDRFCTAMNQRFQKILRLGALDHSDLSNVYVAMLLGRRVELSQAQTEHYRMTGTMHFFAISGLHIGVIATVIAQFLQLIRVPRAISPYIGLLLLYLYVAITGGAPSAIRAFLMIMFFWSSFAFQRQCSPFSTLICSAILVLIIEPIQLWSLGFQLSYTVVASILLFGLPLYQHLTQHCQPYRWLPKEDWNIRQRTEAMALDQILMLFAVSFSAWLASAPLSAGLFECITPGAILLNMLLVYLVAIVISGGIISLTCATVLLPSLAEFINHSAWTVISLMNYAVIGSAQLPGMILLSKNFPPVLSYAILLIYLTLLLWLHQRLERLRSHAIYLPPLVVICSLTSGLLILRTNSG
jgi:competence protein ComEC